MKQPEPNKSCFLALREIILAFDENITETVKYQMPCFVYKNRAFCYLWKDKKSQDPYLLIVEGNRIDHPSLEAGSRKRMKTLTINPNEDIDVNTINEVLTLAIDLYLKGIVKTK